ncbi:sn-glycerol-3-phosphate ABC transporter substrate-binding protein UgpB [Saccharospirillum mangrovi]|uniref:sn-glycerol-3-phosphate ABC transporter substrate-binding protein UgpB n=1 Tax=Saccharospirillum mangrovi TaxID=2161747 RepID=UPI000D37EBBF|nr:sn-glycerol-3-phosphate ABC transporter substrate-binding protein UgpB [Saccharospirillum mangrovi]
MKKTLIALSVGALAISQVQAATDITFWHAMGGELGEKVDQIVADFNASQNDVVVHASYRGNYSETMTGAIAAFRSGEQPDIVQVYEVGTATMMAAEGAVYPAYQLMNQYSDGFDQSAYLSTVTGYYADANGNMLSMPFNSSTPVLYYNKDAFAAAGLPDRGPKTWEEMGEFGQAILDAGYDCGFTTAWQSWIQLENLSARHNVPFATNDDGFTGLDTQVVFNDDLQIAHIEQLAKWNENGLFSYSGRTSEGAARFYSGECPMITASSASYAGVRANASFNFGVSELPYWASKIDTPQNTIIGGATLWTLRGHDESHYPAVARFFEYLSQPEVQADWHQFSGYLPITYAAVELTKEQGFYANNPGTDVAINQMTAVEPTANSRGLRLGNFPQIRDIIDEELESVWNGDATAKQALDRAARRSNQQLRRFERANR